MHERFYSWRTGWTNLPFRILYRSAPLLLLLSLSLYLLWPNRPTVSCVLVHWPLVSTQLADVVDVFGVSANCHDQKTESLSACPTAVGVEQDAQAQDKH